MKNYKNRFNLDALLTKSMFGALGVVVTATVIGLGAAVATEVCHVSDGKRTGTLTKLSYGGAFFKSYEGEMLMGGVRTVSDGKTGDRTVANVWEFSCSSPTVAKRLESLMGKTVTVKYHHKFTVFVRSTGYDVLDVEEVK